MNGQATESSFNIGSTGQELQAAVQKLKQKL